MTLGQIQRVLETVRYKNVVFNAEEARVRVVRKGSRWRQRIEAVRVEAIFYVADRESVRLFGWNATSIEKSIRFADVMRTDSLTKDRLILRLRRLLHWAERHESDEQFLVDGQRPFDPHHCRCRKGARPHAAHGSPAVRRKRARLGVWSRTSRGAARGRESIGRSRRAQGPDARRA